VACKRLTFGQYTHYNLLSSKTHQSYTTVFYFGRSFSIFAEFYEFFAVAGEMDHRSIVNSFQRRLYVWDMVYNSLISELLNSSWFMWGLRQHTSLGIVVGLCASGNTLLGIVVGLCGASGKHTLVGISVVGYVAPRATHFTGYCCSFMMGFGQHTLLGIVVGYARFWATHFTRHHKGLMWGAFKKKYYNRKVLSVG
jgi:hypothetical protein